MVILPPDLHYSFTFPPLTLLLRLILIWWKFPGRPYLPVTSCPILSLLSYHTTGTTTRALTKRGGRKRYLNGKSDRKDAKVGGTGWEENRSEEVLRCTNWSSNNDWPPLGLSIHPDKMSGPLLLQTAMGGWLALPGKGRLWCAIESRLKASPPQCPLFRSFPSHVLSLIHWILAN